MSDNAPVSFAAWIRHQPAGDWQRVASGSLDDCWQYLLGLPAANLDKTVLPSGQQPVSARRPRRRP